MFVTREKNPFINKICTFWLHFSLKHNAILLLIAIKLILITDTNKIGIFLLHSGHDYDDSGLQFRVKQCWV